MGTFVRRHWTASHEGVSRRDRMGCDYDAYLPDPMVGWQLALPGDLVADLADAEVSIRRLTSSGTAHTSLEGLARFLLRAESVASSRIEGLEAGARRLLRSEVEMNRSGTSSDHVAAEVLGNIAAMEAAIELGATSSAIALEDLLDIHRTLMERSPTPRLGGVVRTTQNWIGGSDYHPCSATFVPPPPENLDVLLRDLVDYVNADQHSALVQAALAHAQFETIHPFGDGNGRTGRALIHVILRRRGLAERFVPPISLVLATLASDYISGLTAFRHSHPGDSPERSVAAEQWLRTFAVATTRACADAQSYARQIDELDALWRERIGRVRAGSAVDLLLDRLPGAPLITTETAAAMIGRSAMRTNEAVNRLAEAGVLRQRNVGRRRYRVFEATEAIDLFTGLERALASPTGNTALDPPSRRVPQRP
jgi:Fic family protein